MARKQTSNDDNVSTTNVVEEEKQPVTTEDEFAQVLSELSALRSQLTHLVSRVRQLKVNSARELKKAQKSSRRRKSSGKSKPSGFAKPTPITKELATFLGVDPGTEMARTEVNRKVDQYIKENNLQKSDDKRVIIPDKTLRKLLNLSKSDKLTYFNLQTHMKHLYV